MKKSSKIVAGVLTVGLVGLFLQFGISTAFALSTNTTYYVDNSAGSGCSNSNAGTSTSAPWCDFTNVNSQALLSGDSLLLKAGDVFNEGITPTGSGSDAAHPISIGCYGTTCASDYPTVKPASSSSDAILLTDPSFFSVSNLTLSNASNGIHVHFTTLDHQSLSFTNLYVTSVTNNGIYFDGFNQNPPYAVASGHSIISGVTIDNLSVNAPGGGGVTMQADYANAQETTGSANAQQNIIIQNLYVPNAGGCAINLDNAQNSLVMDSYLYNADTSGGCGTGNYEVVQNNVRYVNSVFDTAAWTNADDNSWFNLDNHMTNLQWQGDYFRGAAGSALEWTENPCFAACTSTTDTSADVESSAFSTNSTYNSSAYFGDIDATYAPYSTGSISHNLYYDVSQPNNSFVRGVNNYTLTDNQYALTDSDLYNAGYQFSTTQGAGGWNYEYWNGTSWNNMTYDSSLGGWSGGTSGLISRTDQLPDSTSSDYVARVWTAPKAGTIHIRGWALKNQLGGSGAGIGIVNGSTWLLPASGSSPGQVIAANDQIGFSTNVDTTVAQGDHLYFLVDTNGVNSNSQDMVSWNPSISYADPSVNLALNKTATSSSNYDSTQVASKAVDGDFGTDWQAGAGNFAGQTLSVDFGASTTFDRVILAEYGSRTTGFRIQYYAGGSWTTAYTGTTIGAMGSHRTFTFPAVTGTQARILYDSGTGGQPILYEFQVFD